jgi:hypothetical protein
VGSEEGEDRVKGTYIVRGGLGFLGGEVDVAAVVGDENVFVSATRFHGQLTCEVRSRGIVAGNSTDERGAVYGVGVKGIPEGRGGRTKRGECEGGLEGWGFGGAQIFSNYV